MLSISPQQMHQIEEEKQNVFFQKLRIEVRKFLLDTSHGIVIIDIDTHIDRILDNAIIHNMNTEQQITRYAYFLAAFPIDFRKHSEYAWLTDILESQIPADERLDSITAALTCERQG